MELQITKEERRVRLKNNIMTVIAIPIILFSLFMMSCDIIYIWNKTVPFFKVWQEILPVTILGYIIFIAKPSLLVAAIGMFLPSKKK